MKKIVLINGVISGLILVAFFLIAKAVGTFGGSYGEVIGYASMLIALSFVFIGVRKIREQQEGKFSFGKAFLSGFLISLIACVFYVVGWMVVDADNTFIADYAASAIKELEEAGASAQEIATVQEEMDGYKELYANPITKAGVTLIEIFPVGLLVSLITAFILKRK